MNNTFCNTCAHFRQHYTFNRRKIFRVNCGHCTYQKVKTKRPDSKACDGYLLSASMENSFATKEYLSKELLEYMLRLELLPEIYDIAEEQSHATKKKTECPQRSNPL